MHTPLKKQNPDVPAIPYPSGRHVAYALKAFAAARVEDRPFRHWLLQDVLPVPLMESVIALPLCPLISEDTGGKRDAHNDCRRFFSPELQENFAPVQEIAALFQCSPAVRAIESLCGVDMRGSYLRIEYCQDQNGFWLEPHRDIKEKHITIQLYLNTGEDADSLGTDLYDAGKRPVRSTPGRMGQGMAFVPAEPGSWHGFSPRPIMGIRRSLLINYVTDDWRSMHELSFPTEKIL